jgi:hypothetical protein
VNRGIAESSPRFTERHTDGVFDACHGFHYAHRRKHPARLAPILVLDLGQPRPAKAISPIHRRRDSWATRRRSGRCLQTFNQLRRETRRLQQSIIYAHPAQKGIGGVRAEKCIDVNARNLCDFRYLREVGASGVRWDRIRIFQTLIYGPGCFIAKRILTLVSVLFRSVISKACGFAGPAINQKEFHSRRRAHGHSERQLQVASLEQPHCPVQEPPSPSETPRTQKART